jgi:hypothetical protein
VEASLIASNGTRGVDSVGTVRARKGWRVGPHRVVRRDARNEQWERDAYERLRAKFEEAPDE